MSMCSHRQLDEINRSLDTGRVDLLKGKGNTLLRMKYLKKCSSSVDF